MKRKYLNAFIFVSLFLNFVAYLIIIATGRMVFWIHTQGEYTALARTVDNFRIFLERVPILFHWCCGASVAIVLYTLWIVMDNGKG